MRGLIKLVFAVATAMEMIRELFGQPRPILELSSR